MALRKKILSKFDDSFVQPKNVFKTSIFKKHDVCLTNRIKRLKIDP